MKVPTSRYLTAVNNSTLFEQRPWQGLEYADPHASDPKIFSNVVIESVSWLLVQLFIGQVLLYLGCR